MAVSNDVSRASVSRPSFTPAAGAPRSEAAASTPAVRRALAFTDGFEAQGARPSPGPHLVNGAGSTARLQPASLQAGPGVTELVRDAYRTHLRREADPVGLSSWSEQAQGLANQGRSQEEIRGWLGEQLRGSSESQALRVTDEVFQEVLGRDVSGGRGYWHDTAARMMGEGQSADQVRETLRGEFMRSPEYGLKHVDQVVSDTFREVLGRESDPNDHWHHVGREMIHQGKGLDEVRDFMRAQFKGSEEYQLNHPEEVVAQQYRELLGREPDPDGLANHVQLAHALRGQGQGLNQIREAIANSIKSSSEYQNRTSGVSLQQLQSIMPHLSEARAQQMLPHLNAAMKEAGIDTPRRQAAFLAQLAHESGEFRHMEEIASGQAYEGRVDLGNTEPGDGVRFKGRGPIQLTGRANYRAASQALGIDLVNNPARAADPDVGFRTAAWFWNSRDLNAAADAGNFDYITYRVNGGYNGKASRDAYYARALQVLGG